MKQIILASKSPGRKKIMALTGLKFKVVPSNYEENLTLKVSAHDLAKHLALGKAKSVASITRHKNAIIIGADTVVVSGKKALGKPYTKKANEKMLKELSGKSHSVITGLTIINPTKNKISTKSVETKVYLNKMSEKEIKDYVKIGESLDKAGGYAAQGIGAALIEKIEGDYFNIIGLPLFTLCKELRKFNVKIF